MGSWFIEYFTTKKDFYINAYDQDLNLIKNRENLTIEHSLNTCVRDSDIVILCVPLRVIPKMIKECSNSMKRNSVIIDIASIKNRTYKSLLKTKDYILPICIHPMFGPGASQNTNLKILFIPIRNREREKKIVLDLFPNFNILSLENAIQHDRIMAVVLGLNHYINIVFADIIGSQKYKNLEFYSGGTFKIQCILSESILNDDPILLNSLLMDNPYVKKEIKNLNKKLLNYYQIIDDKEDKKLINQINTIKLSLEKHHDLNSSYYKMYKLIKFLE